MDAGMDGLDALMAEFSSSKVAFRSIDSERLCMTLNVLLACR
jgi:hypothetical protein